MEDKVKYRNPATGISPCHLNFTSSIFFFFFSFLEWSSELTLVIVGIVIAEFSIFISISPVLESVQTRV